MMEAVKAGGDRQEIHEAVRRASMRAAGVIKEGGSNPMRELLAGEPELAAVAGRLDELLDGARHVGRAPEQVSEFLEAEVEPVLERHGDLVGVRDQVMV